MLLTTSMMIQLIKPKCSNVHVIIFQLFINFFLSDFFFSGGKKKQNRGFLRDESVRSTGVGYKSIF